MTLVPYLSGSDEHKSKPTQHSVKELQGMGINPNIIVLRCDEPLEPEIFSKIALFCNVKPDCVIENITLPVSVRSAADAGEERTSPQSCAVSSHIDAPTARPERMEGDARPHSQPPRQTVTIGLVGKYVQLHDAYLSVAEALRHAGYVPRRAQSRSNGSTPRPLTR